MNTQLIKIIAICQELKKIQVNSISGFNPIYIGLKTLMQVFAVNRKLGEERNVYKQSVFVRHNDIKVT